MVHIKNLRPTSALDGKTPHELMEKKTLTIDHLRVLGSTVYVFIHKANRKGKNSKAAKFAFRAQRGKLVGYDGKTIYRVYLEQNESVIRVKNLSIHEDATAKKDTELSYDATQITKDVTSPQKTTTSTLETAVKKAPIPKRGNYKKNQMPGHIYREGLLLPKRHH